MPTLPHPIGGRYRLLAPVASGAMGSVWRGVDLTDGRLVAVKVLRRGPRADAGAPAPGDTALLRFVAEQGVRVRHPHVLAPTGWAADEHRAAIGMPPVRGGSAADLLAEHGPLPSAWVAAVLDQLLQALVAVHGAGLVHRDVKPANVLLEPGRGRPHARLADFGVATRVATPVTAGPVAGPLPGPRLTCAGGVVGTDGYLAPEQGRGAPPEPRQDLYAAGATAVELLTGRPPVPPPGPGPPPAAPVGPVARAAPVPRVPPLPPALAPLLGVLLDPDPRRRPAGAAAALAALRALPTPAPGAEREWPAVPDRWGATPRRPRRPPARGMAALTALCLGEAASLGATLMVAWPLVPPAA